MATLVGGTSIVIPGTGSAGSESDPKYRYYLSGTGRSGAPAGPIYTHLNAPRTNRTLSGTKVTGATVDPVPVEAIPFWVDFRCTLKTIAINVTVAATSNWRSLIYAAAGMPDKLPNLLVSDSGNVATNPSGIKTATHNIILAPGLYWAALEFQNSAGSTVSVIPATSAENWGTDSTLTPITYLGKTQNFGAGDATWGTTFTQVTATSATAQFAEFGV